eukprot:gb/GEZN01013648.1/.p1 GENE.gb/GEZN01013648.1/~~gb/GEZN01013648.1/.p1  ORF type:complete len:317 (-),score=23.02 gb/GEZN01013648.1/:52-942(-)
MANNNCSETRGKSTSMLRSISERSGGLFLRDVRGPKKHLKRLNAPKAWMLNKLGGIFAPRPSTGPHKLRESLPMTLILRNKLKVALTGREVKILTARRLVKVDGKVRTDITFPCGFMDVITLDKTNENYRVLYDVKGRFILHRITKEEAAYKLCRVTQVQQGSKSTIGRNPGHKGQAGVIPYAVTHDTRTLKYPDPLINVNDTLKIDIKTGEPTDRIPFEVGNLCTCTRGANIGRVGTIVSVDKHPGSFDIVHMRDASKNTFATRIANVFVIGEGTQEWISLPKARGLRTPIVVVP